MNDGGKLHEPDLKRTGPGSLRSSSSDAFDASEYNDNQHSDQDTASAGVLTCNGSFDTKIKTGKDYNTLTWGDILKSVRAIRPRSRRSWRQRSSPRPTPGTMAGYSRWQRVKGSYILWAMSMRDTPKAEVTDALHAILGGTLDMIVYTTASATSDNPRRRFIVRLQHAIPGPDLPTPWRRSTTSWPSATLSATGPSSAPESCATCRMFRWRGVGPMASPCSMSTASSMDPVWTSRPPPSPPAALRTVRSARPSWSGCDRRARRDARRVRIERLRTERLETWVTDENDSLIEKFNACHAITDLLVEYRYEDRGDGLNWQSPLQTSGSFATRVFGDDWFSWSGGDADAGLGCKSASGNGVFGDAFDLFRFYKHGNDFNAALAALRVEEDGAEAESQAQAISATPFDLHKAMKVGPRRWVYGHHLIRQFASATIAPWRGWQDGTGHGRHSGDGHRPGSGWGQAGGAAARLVVQSRGSAGRARPPPGRRLPLLRHQARGHRRPAVRRQWPPDANLHRDRETRRGDDRQAGGGGGAGDDPQAWHRRAGDRPIRQQPSGVGDDNTAIDAVAKELVARRRRRRLRDRADPPHAQTEAECRHRGDRRRWPWRLGPQGCVPACQGVEPDVEGRGEKAGVPDHPWTNFSDDDGKANMSAPGATKKWFHIVSVNLGNGYGTNESDRVGVVTAWQWPAAELPDDKIWEIQQAVAGKGLRKDAQARSQWVGNAIAAVVGLNLNTEVDMEKVKGVVKTLLEAGQLKGVWLPDKKGNLRPCIEVGEWVKLLL